MASLCKGLDLVHLEKLQKSVSDHAGGDRSWLAEDLEEIHTLIELRGIEL